MLSKFKIDQINEKITGNWFFVGRCSFKSIKLNYSRNLSSGTYFYFYLQDDSSEIKVILFNDNVKKNFNLIQFNKLFKLTNGVVSKVSAEWIQKARSAFEIKFNSSSSVKQFWDSKFALAPFIYQFKTIPEFWLVNKKFDFLGLILQVGSTTIKKVKPMREVILLDRTFREVTLVLWAAQALHFTGFPKDILVINHVKIEEFMNTKQLQLTDFSSIQINPKIKEVFDFQIFANLNEPLINKRIEYLINYNENFVWNSLSVLSHSNYLIIHRINLRVKATVSEVGDSISFPQCPFCKKKIEPSKSSFVCNSCKCKTAYPKISTFLTILISDHTKSYWVSVYSELLFNFFNSKSISFISKSLPFKSFIFDLQCNRLKTPSTKSFDAKVVNIAFPDVNYGSFLLNHVSK